MQKKNNFLDLKIQDQGQFSDRFFTCISIESNVKADLKVKEKVFTLEKESVLLSLVQVKFSKTGSDGRWIRKIRREDARGSPVGGF